MLHWKHHKGLEEHHKATDFCVMKHRVRVIQYPELQQHTGAYHQTLNSNSGNGKIYLFHIGFIILN